ncbi:MAG: hypothetical protein ACUVTL_08930 [Thermoproteota archaeon]
MHNYKRIYMMTSGGRKNRSIMMALVAQVAGLPHNPQGCHQVYVMLERIRHDIYELAKSDNLRSYYEAHCKDFEQLMYPEPVELSIIKMSLELIFHIVLIAEHVILCML